MQNQMDSLVEGGIRAEEAFNDWLFEACNIKAETSRKDPHDIFPMVDLTDAKLSFISGETAEEYSKTIL